jgi:hypothetical protein
MRSLAGLCARSVPTVEIGVISAVEQTFQLLGRTLLHSWQNVRVSVQRKGDACVAQENSFAVREYGHK